MDEVDTCLVNTTKVLKELNKSREREREERKRLTHF